MESKVSRFELFNPEHQWHLCPSVLFPVFAFNFNFFHLLISLVHIFHVSGKERSEWSFVIGMDDFKTISTEMHNAYYVGILPKYTK